MYFLNNFCFRTISCAKLVKVAIENKLTILRKLFTWYNQMFGDTDPVQRASRDFQSVIKLSNVKYQKLSFRQNCAEEKIVLLEIAEKYDSLRTSNISFEHHYTEHRNLSQCTGIYVQVM